MSELRSSKVCTVTVVVLIVIGITVPVNSVLYRVVFEPTKMFTPCKSTEIPPIQKSIDFTKLEMKVASDNTLFITGAISFKEQVTDPISAMTTSKMKSRGRWVDTPYSMLIKDWCKTHFEEGKWWTDHITKYFVGDQRICPPQIHVGLPVNVTLSLDLDLPTPVPTGEYMSTTVITSGEKQACFQNTVDLTQAPRDTKSSKLKW